MITPKLEELILCGKAFFKTFVAGGDKHTLTFGNDRFIIITDITYLPMNMTTSNGVTNYDNPNTQVAIYGERGYNHYIFRNYNISHTTLAPDNQRVKDFCGPVTINTYLLHDQQVGFSFCNAPYFSNPFVGNADTNNPGYPKPIEFGIDGQFVIEPVTLTMDANFSGFNIQNNLVTRPASGVSESQQLMFPFTSDLSFGQQFGGNGFNGAQEYPILLVNYVEIIGSSNNISI